MPDKAYFDAKLVEFRELLKRQEVAAAAEILDELSREDEQHHMGETTALDLPRRLHSAMLGLAKAQGDHVRRTGYQYLLVPSPELFKAYGRFLAEERRLMLVKNREPVPRSIHQIWIGKKDVPVSTKAWAAHAMKNGLEYRLWREDDLEREGVASNSIFAQMLEQGDYPGAVDIARYVILSKFGGIYLDCDFYPARDDLSFYDLLPMIGLTAFDEPVPRKTGRGSVLLANSFIATPPGHPVFARMLDVFPDILTRLPKAPAWWATGPLIFTVVARAGSVSLAGGNFVVTSLPDKAPLSDVEAARSRLAGDEDGLLIAWKSW